MAVINKEQRMKIFAVCAALLAALFAAACGPEPETTSNSKLQGTWVSNDPYIYSGTLKITNDRITIDGYYADQTPSRGDDNKRPFKDFTKRAGLKWRSEVTTQRKYSMEGIIYITDRGKEQEGISFYYYEGDLWDDGSYTKKADKFLCFTFGDREEILENSNNHHY
jgi:hypothetical protein